MSGPLSYCEHGAIKMTCPACRGVRQLPPPVTKPVAAPMRGDFNPMGGLTPAEAAQLPKTPVDEGPAVLDLDDIVTRATKKVEVSTQRQMLTRHPSPQGYDGTA